MYRKLAVHIFNSLYIYSGLAAFASKLQLDAGLIIMKGVVSDYKKR